jgi:hypothetical protein
VLPRSSTSLLRRSRRPLAALVFVDIDKFCRETAITHKQRGDFTKLSWDLSRGASSGAFPSI